MHSLAWEVDLPVLRKLPVQRLAERFEDVRRRPIPSRRCDERMRDSESGGLQDLVALAVADVDDHGLEVERLVFGVAYQAHGHVGPNLVAVSPKESLLVPKVGRFPGHHLAVRFFGGGDIVKKRDVVYGHVPELVRRVAQQLAVGLVYRHDLAVEARERHAGLGLLEKGTEAHLALALSLLGAVALGDVGDQGEQAMRSLRDQAVDGNLELQPATVFPDQAGLVTDRRRVAIKPLRKI